MPSLPQIQHKARRTIERGRAVRESARFIACELLARPGRTERYRLRDRPAEIVVRHRTQDLGTLDEVFLSPDYDLPAPVRALLAPDGPRRIVDFGANIGMFSVRVLADYPAAAVLAFEPDLANASVLEHARAANGLASRWVLRRECVGKSDGTARFLSGHFAESRVSADGGTEVAQVDFFTVADDADLVKLDIEGSEWPILRDERLSTLKTRALVLEWHTVPGDGGSAEEALTLLRDSGYEALATTTGEHAGMIWAWRATPAD